MTDCNLIQTTQPQQGLECIASLVDQFSRLRLLVFGDVMLDIDRVGSSTRISPEAPVPVLLNSSTEYRLGGAGALAAMCATLGADVRLISVSGADTQGHRIRQLLRQSKISDTGVVDSTRTTTTKERISAVASGKHQQQIVRLDSEMTQELSVSVVARLRDQIRSGLEWEPDLILISDYAKGTCHPDLIRLLIESDCETIVDPPRSRSWRPYAGATCLVPNRLEARGRTARQLAAQYHLLATAVKLDADGCQIYDGRRNKTKWLPTLTRNVHDVTGAGDQFAAVLGLTRAKGADWWTSARLANLAAGLQVERYGCVPVTLDELKAAISQPRT